MQRLGVVLLTLILLIAGLAIYLTQPLFGVAYQARAHTVAPAKLSAHVRALVRGDQPRDAGHPQNLDVVAAYIHREFALANGATTDQTFQVDSKTYRNVISNFGPETPERIVIGAHYDTHGALPGADDNASGIAGLIELAHLLSKTKLPMRVELVAYTLEEPPYFRTEHMGSHVHAAQLKQQGEKIRAMISLEMIGYFSDADASQDYPNPLMKLLYPARGNFITVVSRLGEASLVRQVKQAMQVTTPLPVYSISAPRLIPGIDFSDHQSYWNMGYPALMVTDTAFNRNRNYHTAEDTPERLDYVRMAQVVEGVHAAVIELAK